MRRCYKCGAKMLTDAIVCEKCEQEINDKFSIRKIREKVMKLFEDTYRLEKMDEWDQGAHYAYHKVLQIIDEHWDSHYGGNEDD